MIEQLSAFIVENRLDSWASVCGLLISIGGFAVTLWKVLAAKTAAEQARTAAEEARQGIKVFDSLAVCSEALAALDEIRRHHSDSNWHRLPDRYAGLNKLLTSLRVANPDLSDKCKTSLQNAITFHRQLENRVEEYLHSGSGLPGDSRFRALVSSRRQELMETLEELKLALGERSS